MSASLKNFVDLLTEYSKLKYDNVVYSKNTNKSDCGTSRLVYLENGINFYADLNGLNIKENIVEGKYSICLSDAMGKVYAQAEYREDVNNLIIDALKKLFEGNPYINNGSATYIRNEWFSLNNNEIICCYFSKGDEGWNIHSSDGGTCVFLRKLAIEMEVLDEALSKLFAVIGEGKVIKVAFYRKHKSDKWHFGKVAL